MSTTSSEAGLLVGGFLRPFLSYNKDTFCRALLRCSPFPLVLSLSLPLSLALFLSFPFPTFSLRLASSSILIPTPVLRCCIALFFCLLFSLFLSPFLINVSFYSFCCPPLLSISISVFLCFSFSFLLLLRAHLYLIPSTRFAPLVVLSCIFFLFSQFRSSSRAFSPLFRSCCLFFPLLFSSSISFFSLRALFPSHPRPVARSAGIRGIFEPVHDGRLLQGRTFLQPCSEIFGTKGLNPRN